MQRRSVDVEDAIHPIEREQGMVCDNAAGPGVGRAHHADFACQRNGVSDLSFVAGLQQFAGGEAPSLAEVVKLHGFDESVEWEAAST